MKSKRTSQAPPDFCTFACPHSDFPPPELAGLCRTMAPVYCKKLKRLVNKNTPCAWKKSRKPLSKG